MAESVGRVKLLVQVRFLSTFRFYLCICPLHIIEFIFPNLLRNLKNFNKGNKKTIAPCPQINEHLNTFHIIIACAITAFVVMLTSVP